MLNTKEMILSATPIISQSPQSPLSTQLVLKFESNPPEPAIGSAAFATLAKEKVTTASRVMLKM
jgi:hypothetical protein